VLKALHVAFSTGAKSIVLKFTALGWSRLYQMPMGPGGELEFQDSNVDLGPESRGEAV